jgi:hypothetical protein
VKRIAAVCLLVLVAAQGCARHRGSPRHTEVAGHGADPFVDARPAAAALVFEPAMELSREGRQPEAFVGYAEGVTEFFYLRWDDRQSNWGSGHHGGAYDRFERRAVSEKVGALYR